MKGIFDNLFDFDGDGSLDIIEQAAELAFVVNIANDKENEDDDEDE
ncbi:MAG: hypothetical protein Q4A83_03300 [Bacillota bacterium]|nr:hypothetical protein [Bacillota bacterium]